MGMTITEKILAQHAGVDAVEPDEIIDKTILEGIKAKQDLDLPLTSQQQKALDPNNQMVRGITKNKKKIWTDFKELVNVEIRE